MSTASPQEVDQDLPWVGSEDPTQRLPIPTFQDPRKDEVTVMVNGEGGETHVPEHASERARNDASSHAVRLLLREEPLSQHVSTRP